MAEIKLVKRVKYAGDIHKKLVDLGWDLETAALFCDDLPDAEVEPVRHGRWIAVPSSDMMTGKAYICSECKKMRWGSFAPNYCQNCGARMDLGGADNA